MSRSSSPNGTVPNVWSDDADDFDHSQLAKNWDALDEGQAPLGSIVMWWRKSVGAPAVPWSTGSVWQPCDGRTLLAANHDLGGGSFTLPDMRGYTLMGAQAPDAVGYPGDGNAGAVNSDTPTDAPGIQGVQGSNAKQTVPGHYHDHHHIHVSGGVVGIETFHADVTDNSVGGLNDSIFASPPYINTDAAGTGHNVTLQAHSHQLAAVYTTEARIPENSGMRVVDAPGQPASSVSDASSKVRPGTSLQKKTDGTDAEASQAGDTSHSVSVSPGGGTAGDALQVSPQQHSYGVVFLMKVRVTPR